MNESKDAEEPLPRTGELVAERYELLDEIGRGGFGVVFSAQDKASDRWVALKLLMPHALSYEGIKERFEREAHLASSLDHPNTIDIFDYGFYEREGRATLPFITMELLSGTTLGSHIRKKGSLSDVEARPILMQVLRGLEAAHQRGVIHRDMKPANVFICDSVEGDEPLVKVLDFGIAKAITGDWDEETFVKITRTGYVPGTPEYMSPEQAMGKKDLTPAADVYSVGCIAFAMLTGRMPFRGKHAMDTAVLHLTKPIPPLPDVYQDTPLGLAIRKAMAKEARDRFEDARAFAEALATGHVELGVRAGVAGKTSDVMSQPVTAVAVFSPEKVREAVAQAPEPQDVALAPTLPASEEVKLPPTKVERASPSLPESQPPQAPGEVVPPPPEAPTPAAEIPLWRRYGWIFALLVLLGMGLGALVVAVLTR